MDKDLFVHICKNYYSNSLTINEIVLLFSEYCCTEKKSNKINSSNIVEIISSLKVLGQLPEYLACIIDYYERKFTIIKVYNNVQKEKILLIN